MIKDYETPAGDYIYGRDRFGGYAEGVLKTGAVYSRDRHEQLNAGVADRQPGDNGSHFIPHAAGGRPDGINLEAVNKDVNQKDIAAVERDAMQLSKNETMSIYYGSRSIRDNGSERASNIQIQTAAYDRETGKEDVVHHSFTNASHTEQSAWDELATKENPVDIRQNSGMSEEQRDIANEYIGQEDSYPDGLGKGEYTHFENQESNDMIGALSENTFVEEDQNISENESDSEYMIDEGCFMDEGAVMM